MININKISKSCTGCGVCANICPVSAVQMKPDEFGFFHPNVDKSLCSNCGLCEKKCPVISSQNVQSLKKAYYGRALDDSIVSQSSSGGIFTVLAQEIIDNDGVVYGAIFDSATKKILFSNTDEVELDKLRRSKYAESCTGTVYLDVQAQLGAGRLVLFSGMPCQVAGLKKFLGKEYENLFTCDFICGGGASPQYFREHLSFLEKKFNSNVVDVNFRPKLYGWKEHSIKIDFDNGKEYRNYAYLDSYFRGFVNEQITIRESCADCKFRNNHASDIIMADFWGYRQIQGLKIDNKGMSLIVTNSEKGEYLLHKASEHRASMAEIDIQYATYNFKPKCSSSELSQKRRTFKENYLKYGFEKAARKTYMKNCIKYKLKKSIKRMLKGMSI